MCLNLDPHVAQHYNVEYPDKESFGKTISKYSVREYKTALAVYSMWVHFLDFHQHENKGNSQELLTMDSTNILNPHTNRRRLKTFVGLSNGISMQNR
jgi:hypothetical protein